MNANAYANPYSAKCAQQIHTFCKGQVGRWNSHPCHCYCHEGKYQRPRPQSEENNVEDREDKSPLIWDGKTMLSETDPRRFRVVCMMCSLEDWVTKVPKDRVRCENCGSGFTVVDPDVGQHHESIYKTRLKAGDEMKEPKPITPYVWWHEIKGQEEQSD